MIGIKIIFDYLLVKLQKNKYYFQIIEMSPNKFYS